MTRRIFVGTLSFLFTIIFLFQTCIAASKTEPSTNYGLVENWAYLENDVSGKSVDVFFVCPTVFRGDKEHFNMDIKDNELRRKFVGATNMEKGIYDEDARFFAPYYRMAGLNTYGNDQEVRYAALKFAYKDVRCAFLYYLKYFNNGRPFILAGFSQGSNHILSLLKEFGNDKIVKEKMIAAYCPGYAITKEDILEYPHLKPAKGEADTGVIISFNTEAEDVTSSRTVGKDVKSISINPLSWRTDSKKADKSLNKGACFTDYDGNIQREVPELTGAYIDAKRGTLKVTDVKAEDYASMSSVFGKGVYHIYDYQFFYRNLQENVATRIQAFLKDVKD